MYCIVLPDFPHHDLIYYKCCNITIIVSLIPNFDIIAFIYLFEVVEDLICSSDLNETNNDQ